MFFNAHTFGEELYFKYKYKFKITKLKCVPSIAVFFTAHSLKGFAKTLALLRMHTSKLLSNINELHVNHIPQKQQ